MRTLEEVIYFIEQRIQSVEATLKELRDQNMDPNTVGMAMLIGEMEGFKDIISFINSGGNYDSRSIYQKSSRIR